MKLVGATSVVNTEEACLCLREVELMRPDSKGLNRYLVITIIRPDGPMDFQVDLGPAKDFDAEQFYVPTGGKDQQTGKYWSVHTVGEALDIANQLREGPREAPEPPAERFDLVGAYYDQADKLHKVRKKLSTFGPGAALQRS